MHKTLHRTGRGLNELDRRATILKIIRLQHIRSVAAAAAAAAQVREFGSGTGTAAKRSLGSAWPIFFRLSAVLTHEPASRDPTPTVGRGISCHCIMPVAVTIFL